MPQPRLTDEQLVEALNLYEKYGSATAAVAAKATTLPRSTIVHRIEKARLAGLRPSVMNKHVEPFVAEKRGRMHFIIPDVQAKEGVRLDHMSWVGKHIVNLKPDVIICIGDFWDMPSLSSYDKGKLSFEGRRYTKDIKAGRDAMKLLMAPIQEYNATAEVKYEPVLEFLMGNHEQRVLRVMDLHPEFEGKFGYEDFGLEEFGWKVHNFLEVVEHDGVEYSHYFTSGAMGRPASSAAVVLRERQGSATMGHVQHTDIAIHKKTQQTALFCGVCYLHDETYLGPQGNDVKRQVIVKREVEEGRYDLQLVSLGQFEKAYG